MIYNIQTYCTYGYWPEDLGRWSEKLIVIACNNCGKIRIVKRSSYRDLCKKCSQQKRRFNELPKPGTYPNLKNINEEMTFEKFGYYSTQISKNSRKSVVVVCDICGEIRVMTKSHYSDICKSCAQLKRYKDNPVSDESKEKMVISQTERFKNNPVTDETKNTLCISQKKRFEDPKEHEKLSIAHRKRYAEMDDPGLEIIKHHIAYDFNNTDDLIVKITSRFHSSIHHPKGVSFAEHGYSLID